MLTLAYVLIFAPIVLLAQSLVFGFMSSRLAQKKGYEGYFWTGFFLGAFGLLYVVGLPSRTLERIKEYVDLIAETLVYEDKTDDAGPDSDAGPSA